MKKHCSHIYAILILSAILFSCGQMNSSGTPGNFPSPGSSEGNDALDSLIDQSYGDSNFFLGITF
jgi:hypothetical protein